jgi:hypothetical protein
MEGNARIWFTRQQRAELWERWKSGQCVASHRWIVGFGPGWRERPDRLSCGRGCEQAAKPNEEQKKSAQLIWLASRYENEEPQGARSVRPCAAEFDDLAPLLSFFSDELSEIGGRARKQRCSELRKSRFRLRIG